MTEGRTLKIEDFNQPLWNKNFITDFAQEG